MCVSVAGVESRLVSCPAHAPPLSPGSRGGRLAGRPAMAPALTQAPTPHQRCCPPPSSTSSSSSTNLTTLFPPVKGKARKTSDPEDPDDVVVWPSPQCCGGGVGGVGAAVKNGRGANGSRSLKQKTPTTTNKSGREIARSDEASKSCRGPAGNPAAPGGGPQALDPSHQHHLHHHPHQQQHQQQQPPSSNQNHQQNPQVSSVKSPIAAPADLDGQARPINDDDVAISDLALATAVASPRPLTNGGGSSSSSTTTTTGGGRITPPTSTATPNLNGSAAGTKTMGLQPTAPGDRMDIDSSPLQPPAPRTTSTATDWTTTTGSSNNLNEDDGQCLMMPPVSEDGAMQVEPSVEDVILDVIKSMEAGGGGDHQPSCLGLSEAEQELLRDAVASLPDASCGSLPTAEAARVVVVDKAAEVERRLAEARTKQQAIESRCQSLLRRAGRLQSRHVSRHVADQVSNFVAYARETLSLGTQGRSAGSAGANLYGWAEDGRLPTREEVRNIPTATLVNLVSRLQAPPVSYLSNRRYFGLSSRSSASSSSTSAQQQHHQHQQAAAGARQQLSSQVAETLEEVAGLWEAQLRYLQRCDDPDATESSSGGESDDDVFMPPVSAEASADAGAHGDGALPPVKPVSTYQRAAWRWARDRAAVAARWSWLQAQVSDLEYRIRQHTDVYRQLRAAKGPIHFASPPPNGLTATTTTTTTSPSSGTTKDPNSPLKDEDPDAACNLSSSRTRPLVTASGSGGGFRHRRLIKASQHGAGSLRRPSRGANGSTVRCCCVMSRIYHPCVLCNGKNNYLLPVDPDGMTLGERIALTDRGFHPVLSLPQDAPLGAHVDSLLKSGDWRPPPPPSVPAPVTKGLRRSSSKPGEDDGGVGGGGNGGGSAKRRLTANNKRKKMEGGTLDDAKAERRKTLLKRRKRAAMSADAMDEDSASFPSSPFGDGGGSVPSTPGRPGGGHPRGSVFHDMMRRRTSYDIDNIVIPYSMAATTRVERLQYKEIQTPKWRLIQDGEDGPPVDEPEQLPMEEDRDEDDDDVEDVGDEACQARHERSEAEERRKFMSYLKQPAGVTRGRRRVDHMVVADSRADQSSGANTPDQPMSPAPPADAASAAPGTSSKMLMADDAECPVDGAEGGVDGTFTASAAAAAIKERRRTASLTKRDGPWKFMHDDNSAMSWDVDEVIPTIRTVAPYEPRVFPLPDSTYQQLMEEMPPDEPEDDVPGHNSKQDTPVSSSATNTTTGGGGGGTVVGAGAAATATGSTYDQSRAVTPVTFVSESVDSLSPAEDAEDLDVDDMEDPNDPEWEGSQGSAPRGRKR